MRPAALLVALLFLCACSRDSAYLPIPPQSPRIDAPDPPAVPCFVSMSETRADRFIVRGIPLGLGSGVSRWTADRAAVRCKLPAAGPWNIAMDFNATGITMRETGPITLTFTVNGREVGRMRCEQPGAYQFRAPLPADLAASETELVLEAAIDPPWIAPEDGNKLGVLVSAIGFLQP